MNHNKTLDAAASGAFQLGDLTVNRLGFGAMRVTGEGIWGPPKDHDAAIRVLKRVPQLGITLIDTADSYGPNVSEELIAEALHPYSRDLVIATKGGLERTGPGQWPVNGHPKHLRQACEGSLRRLKVEAIDLYQLHRPDPEIPFEDSLGTLVDMQQEGKIRHIGLSNVSVVQLEQALAMAEIVSVQNRYNLTDRGSADVLDACEEHGIGFIPWYPLATGDLAESGGPLDEMAQRYEAQPSQIALAWLLHRSSVMLPIPGTSSVEHLEENVGAASIKLEAKDVQTLNEMS